MKKPILPAILPTLAIIAIISAIIVLAGDPRTNNSNPEPPRTPLSVTNGARPMPPRLNRRPQQLESVVQMTNSPATSGPNQAPEAPPPAPKPIAIVMRDVYAVQANPSTPPLLVVPERYLHDLTNIYRHQFIPVLRLEEP